MTKSTGSSTADLTDNGMLSSYQAAERLGVSASTIRNWVRKGILPEHRIGNRLVHRESDIELRRRSYQHATPIQSARSQPEPPTRQPGGTPTRHGQMGSSPMLQNLIQRAQADYERVRPFIERAQADYEHMRPFLAQAQQEYERVRPFIERAQADYERMRPFLEQTQRDVERMRPAIEQAYQDFERIRPFLEQAQLNQERLTPLLEQAKQDFAQYRKLNSIPEATIEAALRTATAAWHAELTSLASDPTLLPSARRELVEQIADIPDSYE